jgi:DNA-binding LytR/AlgR family response regulator
MKEKKIDLSSDDDLHEDWRELLQKYQDEIANDPGKALKDPDYWGSSQYLFYTEKGENKRVKLKEITYLQADDNYVRVYFRDGKYALVRSSMYKILFELPYKRFMKISKSHFVVVKRVTAYTKEYVKINDVLLPIFKSYLPEVMYRLVVLGTY